MQIRSYHGKFTIAGWAGNSKFVIIKSTSRSQLIRQYDGRLDLQR
jgi:hypothetical protein